MRLYDYYDYYDYMLGLQNTINCDNGRIINESIHDV